MGTYEDFDIIIRFVFILLLLPVPQAWHSKILPISMLCYFMNQLPFTPAGDLDFAILDRLNWGLLPIEQLWPAIRDNHVMSSIIMDHCSEFTYNQMLWVGKNDPLNRVFLFSNHECMMDVSFSQLDLEDFQSHFLELPIFSVFDLDEVPEEVIVLGLQRIDYHFPSRVILERFLSRLPNQVLKNRALLSDVRALNLFSLNYLFKEPIDSLAYINFLFQMDWACKTPLWKISLLDLADFVDSFPALIFSSRSTREKCEDFIEKDPALGQMISNPEFKIHFFANFRLLTALQLRDASFFASLGPAAFIEAFGRDLGAFDQYRVMSSLLPGNLAAFNDYFDANLFQLSVLNKFLTANPRIFDAILPSASPKLLRSLSFHPQDAHAFKPVEPSPVSHPNSLNFDQIVGLTGIQRLRFHHGSFRIKYADDPVVDLGGPLLDWITGVLQRILDLGLFSGPSGAEAEARDFLDVRVFKLLGLLHGKLVQIGSGPAWVPSIPGTLLDKTSALVSMKYDPAEAVRLFNEFSFPGFSDPSVNDPPFRVCSHAEIKLYLTRFERLFNAWRSRAWEQYYIGLRVFILDRIPRTVIRKLLLPLEAVTPTRMASKSHVHFNPDIPYNLSEIWLHILESLSPDELVKLLIFVTGQSQLMTISVHFVITSPKRLPGSRTCFQRLNLYVERPLPPPQTMTESLTDALQTSIHNYQGFGNI